MMYLSLLRVTGLLLAGVAVLSSPAVAGESRNYYRLELRVGDRWRTGGLIMLVHSDKGELIEPVGFSFDERLTLRPERISDVSIDPGKSLKYVERGHGVTGKESVESLEFHPEKDGRWLGSRTLDGKPAGEARLLPVPDLETLRIETLAIHDRIALERTASETHVVDFSDAVQYWEARWKEADADQRNHNGIGQSDVLSAIARAHNVLNTALKLEQAHALRLTSAAADAQKAIAIIDAGLPRSGSPASKPATRPTDAALAEKVKQARLDRAGSRGRIPVLINEVRLIGARVDLLREHGGDTINSPDAKAYNAARTELSVGIAKSLQLEAALSDAVDKMVFAEAEPPAER